MIQKNSLILPVFLASLILAALSGQNQDNTDFSAYQENIAGSKETISMVPVPGGEFSMGSEAGEPDEAPEHTVQVGGFWMGTYEITWDQYQLFADRNIDSARDPDRAGDVTIEVDAVAAATTPYVDMSHGMGRKGFPVVNITEYAALMFCKWLSAKTGRFYRLQTEAEWEYAGRGGRGSAYYFGDDTTHLSEYAWYKGNSPKKYQQVGQKKPNAYGLYDMLGNVAEWTMDQYDPDAYSRMAGKVTKDPWVMPEELYPRAVRGGSWQDEATDLRVSARKGSKAAWKRIDPQIPKSRWWFTNAPHVGFRIIRPRITPSPEEIEQYWLEAIDDF
jgi:formylglycine-generating enzyme required for sulfatase activity